MTRGRRFEAAQLEATKGVVDDPTARLRRAEAPRDLLGWTTGRTLDALWDECDRGDWLVWLAAVERVPVVALVEAAVRCARQAVVALPSDSRRGPITEALKAADELTSSQRCGERAAACETLVNQPSLASYRAASPTPLEWAAAAAGCAARAAEALLAAEARREGERDAEGRLRAVGIGVGDQIISRGDFPPLVFEPDDELMALCVHAAASAVGYATRALAPGSPSLEQLEAAEGELSEIVFERVDPVRTGLRHGADPRSLVRVVTIEPFADTEATKNQRGELAPAEQLDKKPLNAVAVALVFPAGGLGHLYANHRLTGGILFIGGVASLLASVGLDLLSPWAWLTIVVADAALAPSAVRRHNRGEVHASTAQVVRGAFILSLALLLGVALQG